MTEIAKELIIAMVAKNVSALPLGPNTKGENKQSLKRIHLQASATFLLVCSMI